MQQRQGNTTFGPLDEEDRKAMQDEVLRAEGNSQFAPNLNVVMKDVQVPPRQFTQPSAPEYASSISSDSAVSLKSGSRTSSDVPMSDQEVTNALVAQMQALTVAESSSDGDLSTTVNSRGLRERASKFFKRIK